MQWPWSTSWQQTISSQMMCSDVWLVAEECTQIAQPEVRPGKAVQASYDYCRQQSYSINITVQHTAHLWAYHVPFAPILMYMTLIAAKIPNLNKADCNLTRNRLHTLFYCIFLTLTYRTFAVKPDSSSTGPPFGAVHSCQLPFVFVHLLPTRPSCTTKP